MYKNKRTSYILQVVDKIVEFLIFLLWRRATFNKIRKLGLFTHLDLGKSSKFQTPNFTFQTWQGRSLQEFTWTVPAVWRR